MEELRAILESVGPSGNTLGWDIALYALFLLNVVILLLLPDGSTLGTGLSIAVILCLFIDKTYAFGHLLDSGPTLRSTATRRFVGTYLIRCGLRRPADDCRLTDKDSAHDGHHRRIGGWSIALRWFSDQRDVAAPNITCFNSE